MSWGNFVNTNQGFPIHFQGHGWGAVRLQVLHQGSARGKTFRTDLEEPTTLVTPLDLHRQEVECSVNLSKWRSQWWWQL